MKKTLTIVALAAVSAISLSACVPGASSSQYDKSETKTFSSGKAGKAEQALPSWVPDEATDVRLLFRTTGAERIVAMKNAATLPGTCSAVPAGQKPVSSEDPDSRWPASELSNGPASLSADWWPNGTEQKATSVCGRWWVTVDGDTTYAYAPETTAIADDLKSNQK